MSEHIVNICLMIAAVGYMLNGSWNCLLGNYATGERRLILGILYGFVVMK
jgi:hypothetical protein